jgi:hypothetical protein
VGLAGKLINEACGKSKSGKKAWLAGKISLRKKMGWKYVTDGLEMLDRWFT